jgi:hypothetical protein
MTGRLLSLFQVAAVNASLKLSLGQLLDTGVDLGTFTQDAYDVREIEFVVRFKF